jgi:hypothetical protein
MRFRELWKYCLVVGVAVVIGSNYQARDVSATLVGDCDSIPTFLEDHKCSSLVLCAPLGPCTSCGGIVTCKDVQMCFKCIYDAGVETGLQCTPGYYDHDCLSCLTMLHCADGTAYTDDLCMFAGCPTERFVGPGRCRDSL